MVVTAEKKRKLEALINEATRGIDTAGGAKEIAEILQVRSQIVSLDCAIG